MHRFLQKKPKPKPKPEPKPFFKSYMRANTKLSDQGGYYLASDYAKIYNYPKPPSTPIVFGVISLGGSLYGMYNPTSCILTAGDVQNYWQFCGVMPANQPKVLIVPLLGAVLNPTVADTDENTMDVSTIGACCPGSNVTIVLYVAPNSNEGFQAAFRAAINGVTTAAGVKIPKSTVISCSWGSPEYTFTASDIKTYNSLFQSAAGIPICAASGDAGASDGGPGKNVDFPASSPYVIACGGTTLTCPNLAYDASTKEVAWSYNTKTGGGGGGYSTFFPMPAWQTALQSTQPVLKASNMRAVPDIAMNADPNTGVQFLIGCTTTVCGGTSVVAPAMAALIGCIGNPKFSCANIYAATTAFRDITSGNNGGFAAGVKYDCATGLGSPNGVLLAAPFAAKSSR